MVDLLVPLEQDSTLGRGGHGVDQPGLERSGYLRRGQWHGVEAGLLPQFDVLVVAGPDEHLELLHVIRGLYRRLSEETRPAGVGPTKKYESLGFQLLFDLRTHLFEDTVQLAIVGVDHRDLNRQHAAVNVGQSGAAQKAGVESPEPHLADHIGIVASHAARVKAKPHLPAGSLLPRRTHLLQDLVPFGTLGSERRHFDDDLLGRPCSVRRCQHDQRRKPDPPARPPKSRLQGFATPCRTRRRFPQLSTISPIHDQFSSFTPQTAGPSW